LIITIAAIFIKQQNKILDESYLSSSSV